MRVSLSVVDKARAAGKCLRLFGWAAQQASVPSPAAGHQPATLREALLCGYCQARRHQCGSRWPLRVGLHGSIVTSRDERAYPLGTCTVRYRFGTQLVPFDAFMRGYRGLARRPRSAVSHEHPQPMRALPLRLDCDIHCLKRRVSSRTSNCGLRPCDISRVRLGTSAHVREQRGNMAFSFLRPGARVLY